MPPIHNAERFVMIARYPLAFVAGYYFAAPFFETYYNLKAIKKMAFRPKPTAVESDSPAPRSAWNATLHESSNKRDATPDVNHQVLKRSA